MSSTETPEESRMSHEAVPLTSVSPADIDDFVRLRPQLSSRLIAPELVEQYLRGAVESLDAAVFVIRDDAGRIQATITGAVVHTPYGKKGWLEDLVVDAGQRGLGYGGRLMAAVHAWLLEHGVKVASLTSNKERIAAGKMYEKIGYAERPTRVYQIQLAETSEE